MNRTKEPKHISDAVNASPTKHLMGWEEAQFLALETFSTEAFLSVNKRLLSAYGPILAVYIGNLVDKLNYFRNRGMLEEDSSFFLRYEDQVLQTRMSEYQLRGCKNKLKDMKVLYTEMRGIPPKEFYILDLDRLVKNLLMNIPKKTLAKPLKKPKGSPFKNFSNIKENKFKENKFKENKETSSSDSAAANGKITPSQFEEFWRVYPRKVDKGKTKSKWETICGRKNGTRPTWKEVKKAILLQKKTERWRDPKFIPHPTTWLNQQRWLDDPTEMTVFKSDSAKNKITIGSGITGEFDDLQF